MEINIIKIRLITQTLRMYTIARNGADSLEICANSAARAAYYIKITSAHYLFSLSDYPRPTYGQFVCSAEPTLCGWL